MGVRFDRLRCEVFQNLFLSPMNTVFVRPAVATVLTVYGIETASKKALRKFLLRLQQYLPFTVLKLHTILLTPVTICCNSTYRLRYWNINIYRRLIAIVRVATVLTVYGIETMIYFLLYHKNKKLQQYLPFIVLNLVCLIWDTYDILSIIMMRTIMEIE